MDFEQIFYKVCGNYLLFFAMLLAFVLSSYNVKYQKSKHDLNWVIISFNVLGGAIFFCFLVASLAAVGEKQMTVIYFISFVLPATAGALYQLSKEKNKE